MWCFLCFQIVSMKSQRTSCCRILDYYHDGFLLPFGCIQHRYPSDEFIHWFDSCQCTVYFKFTLGVKIFGFFNCSRNPDKPMGFVNNHTFSAYILNAEIPLFSLKIKSLISRITHYKLAFCCFLFCCCFNMQDSIRSFATSYSQL
jgi:hypothetical protein